MLSPLRGICLRIHRRWNAGVPILAPQIKRFPKMKSTLLVAMIAAGLAISLPGHAATYSFSGFFGETLPPGQTDYTATFSFTTTGFITSDTTILASEMTECSTHASACASATFYTNAAAAGLSPDHPDREAIAFSGQYSTSYYYFEAPAFTVDGVHTAVQGVGPGTLTVNASAVPEPSPIALLGVGLPVLMVASIRRRPATKN
jgi:hypothetical protein